MRGTIECSNDNLVRKNMIAWMVLESLQQSVNQNTARQLVKEQVRQQDNSAEIRKLKRELNNFLRLIADGGASKSVLAEIRQREELIEELEKPQSTRAHCCPINER